MREPEQTPAVGAEDVLDGTVVEGTLDVAGAVVEEY